MGYRKVNKRGERLFDKRHTLRGDLKRAGFDRPNIPMFDLIKTVVGFFLILYLLQLFVDSAYFDPFLEILANVIDFCVKIITNVIDFFF